MDSGQVQLIIKCWFYVMKCSVNCNLLGKTFQSGNILIDSITSFFLSVYWLFLFAFF